DGSNDAFNDNERNVISGNGNVGLLIQSLGTDSSVVAGNYIGTDSSGSAAIPNSAQGIVVQTGARMTRIGTNADAVADSSERNVISGNNSTGVQIADASTTLTVVAGNYIGTNASGTGPVANNGQGIIIANGATFNRIGTDGTHGAFNVNERNIISGNTG